MVKRGLFLSKFHNFVSLKPTTLEHREVTNDSKHTERWRPAYFFRTSGDADLKSAILKTCSVRNENVADQVRLRVQCAISDLHVADVRYHVNCKSSFMSPKNVNVANTSVLSPEDDLGRGI